jgi:hypothetical protein
MPLLLAVHNCSRATPSALQPARLLLLLLLSLLVLLRMPGPP